MILKVSVLLRKEAIKEFIIIWSKHRYINEFGFRLDKGNCVIDIIDRVRVLKRF